MATHRKQRRAAARSQDGRSSGTDLAPSAELDGDGVDYLLQHPDRAGPKGKTLFELAEERQRELNRGKARPSRPEPDSNTPAGERPFNDEPIGPFGDALLYSVSLAALHLTLDVIVYSQYRERVVWAEVLQRAATVLPVFMVLVYLLHVDLSRRFPVARNVFFLGVSVAAGCYMVYSGNTNGYFFVMKSAPPIGALWIWSVVEMSFPFAFASFVAVAGYLWWNGFEAF